MNLFRPLYGDLIRPLYEKVGADINFSARLAECGALVVSDGDILSDNYAEDRAQEGHAITFDGIDDYGRGEATGLSTSTDFTISAWVYKPDNLNGGFNVLWSSGLVGNTRVRFSGTSSRLFIVSTDTGIDLPLATWSHVAVRYVNSAAVSLSVDGVEEWVGNVGFTNLDFINIGAQSDGSTISGGFKGYIADFKIESVDDAGLNRHFKLDETSGDIMFDSSTNKGHGVYHGTPVKSPVADLPYSYPNQEGFSKTLFVKSNSGSVWGGDGMTTNEKIQGDFLFEFYIGDSSSVTTLGVSTQQSSTLAREDYDAALYVKSGTQATAYVNGVAEINTSTSLVEGDKFGIKRVGDVVEFYQNDALIYTAVNNITTDDVYVCFSGFGTGSMYGLMVDKNHSTLHEVVSPTTVENWNIPREGQTQFDVLGGNVQYIDSAYPTKYKKRKSNALDFDGLDDHVRCPPLDILQTDVVEIYFKGVYGDISEYILGDRDNTTGTISVFFPTGESLAGKVAVLQGLSIRAFTNSRVYTTGDILDFCIKSYGDQSAELYVEGILEDTLPAAVPTSWGVTNYSIIGNRYDDADIKQAFDYSGEMYYLKVVVNGVTEREYNFAEGNGDVVYDISDNENHGIKYGTIPNTLQDVNHANLDNGFSRRMHFDGDLDSITFGDVDVLNYDNGFKVKAKFVFNESSGIVAIASKAGGGGTARWICYFTDGRPYLLVGDGTSQLVAASIETFDDNKPHEIIYEVDITSPLGLKLFVDGVEISYTTQPNPTPITSMSNAVDLEVGLYNETSGEFTGLIWDVEFTDMNDVSAFKVLGTGNTNDDWKDQIGTNHGTVTGGSLVHIPAKNKTTDALNDTLTNPPITDGHNAAETELDFLNVGENDTIPLEVGKVVPVPPSDWGNADRIDPSLYARQLGEYVENLAGNTSNLETISDKVTPQDSEGFYTVTKLVAAGSEHIAPSTIHRVKGTYILKIIAKAGTSTNLDISIRNGDTPTFTAVDAVVESGSANVFINSGFARISDLDSSESVILVQCVVDSDTTPSNMCRPYFYMGGVVSTTIGDSNLIKNIQIYEGTLDQKSPDFIGTTTEAVAIDTRTGYDRYILMDEEPQGQECLNNLCKYLEKDLVIIPRDLFGEEFGEEFD